MVKRSEQANAAQEVKRLTDYVQQGQQFEGERLAFEKLLGEDFKLLDFATLPSKMSEDPEGKPRNFLVMQVEWQDKTWVTSCGAGQVVDAVTTMPKQYLPVILRVVKDKNPKSGRMYYRVE